MNQFWETGPNSRSKKYFVKTSRIYYFVLHKLHSSYHVSIFSFTVDEDDEISIKEVADMVMEAMNFKNGVQVLSFHNSPQNASPDGVMVKTLQIISFIRYSFW